MVGQDSGYSDLGGPTEDCETELCVPDWVDSDRAMPSFEWQADKDKGISCSQELSNELAIKPPGLTPIDKTTSVGVRNRFYPAVAVVGKSDDFCGASPIAPDY